MKIFLSLLAVLVFTSDCGAFMLQSSGGPVFKVSSGVVVAAGVEVTIPSGTIAVFLMDEGAGDTFELNYSTRTGELLGSVWNSTGGARGNPGISNTGATGYVSVPSESWMAGHAGASNAGEQTVLMCVEPRQSASGAGHPLGFWSHENNSGTKYAYTIFYQNNNTLSSRLSSSVGAGVSTVVSTAGVLNPGERNSIVARVDKAQTQALSSRIFVNKNPTTNSASGTLAATTDPGLDLRFGLQGADPSSYSNSNISIYMYLYRNVTQGEIDDFHEDCSALN